MFLTYITLGFFSGLILNFMPCIMPILGIKMLSFAKVENKKEVVLTALFTIIGILTFMLILSLIFVFVQDFWGFQMQSIAFTASLLFIFIIFAGVLMNFITIYTPILLQSFSDVNTNSNFLKSFVSGFLVVVFSASCTGPIIAISVSLGMQSESIIAMPIICFFMGLGLSMPYILIALFPNKILKFQGNKKLSHFIKVTSILMILFTIFFILYILYGQLKVLGFSCLILVITFFTFVVKKIKRISVIIIGILIIFIASLFVENKEIKTFKGAENFNEDKISVYLNQNKKVLVRFEASWCLTCLANDAFNLKTGEFEKLLAENDVVYMKGDLTNHNIILEHFMKKFNSHGLPFNALFTAKNPNGKLLPLLLSLNDLKLELKED